jgi:hypothetical protein
MRPSHLYLLWQFWKDWLERRHIAELERIRARLEQDQWRNSLANRAHKADLAAGYSQSHFNTMQ